MSDANAHRTVLGSEGSTPAPPVDLSEFFAIVASYPDEPTAVRGALSFAREALGAEAVALLRHGEVAAVDRADGPVGAGSFAEPPPPSSLRVDLEPSLPSSVLVLVRHASPFTTEEAALARSLGRTMALAMAGLRLLGAERALRKESQRRAEESARMLGALRERQEVFDRLAKVQRSISRRLGEAELFSAIVRGAAELLGDEVAALRLRDLEQPAYATLVAAVGVTEDEIHAARWTRIGEGAGGRAIAEDVVCVVSGAEPPDPITRVASHPVRSAIAAPMRDGANVVGSIMTASRQPLRRYTQAEREALASLADHAASVLGDVREEQARAEASLHDALTGLPNRALFFDRAAQARARARRGRARYALLVVDLDHVGKVNEALGHDAGDAVIAETGARLVRCLRDSDTAARLGGDQFAVLVDDVVVPADAAAVAERVRAALVRPHEVAGSRVIVTASIGIAHGGASDEPARVLQDAATASEHARSLGADRVVTFEPAMRGRAAARLALRAELEHGIECDELEVHYQPLVSLGSGFVTGFEALVRWAHPERGLLLPDEFVPAAEEAGFIVPLGRAVLWRACADASGWRRRHPGVPLHVSVNLSAAEFMRASLLADVGAALDASGLPAEGLMLEITESLFMRDDEAILRGLWDLKRFGVGLAIDDFGTGYSGLSYLKRFPLDVLKIDKTFIDGIEGGPEDSALARAIVKLGHSLGVKVVAEGVENDVQARALREMGCDEAQGFHFSAPMAAADVEAYLDRMTGRPRRRLTALG